MGIRITVEADGVIVFQKEAEFDSESNGIDTWEADDRTRHYVDPEKGILPLAISLLKYNNPD